MRNASPSNPNRNFFRFARASAILASLSWLLTCSLGETPEAIAAKLARQIQESSLALEIATDLTTEIGPRLYGSENEKRAAEWAMIRFHEYGYDRVWSYSFPVERGWQRGEEIAAIVEPSPQNLVVTALGGSVPTPPEGIEAEIAHFTTIDAMLAEPVGALDGKIAVVTEGMAIGQYARISGAIRSKGPSEAARRGAIAFLMRSAGTDSDRIAHTGGTRYADDAPRIPAGALSVPDAQQIDRLAQRSDTIRIKLTLTPTLLGPVTSQNVIAEIVGRERPDEIVLLGAHLDSWDLGTGAIDDGSGVGIVMAAGKLIAALPQPPKRTIRIVLFGAEEIGIVGGQHYADVEPLDRHIVAMEADAGQGPVEFMNIGVGNPLDPSLARIRKALEPLGVKPGRSKSNGGPDIGPMHSKGVPAIGLQMNTDDYFDLHHTPNDTIDKIVPKRINQSAAAFVATGYLAAELDGYYRASDR